MWVSGLVGGRVSRVHAVTLLDVAGSEHVIPETSTHRHVMA
jgi:hypothetical protein